MSNFIKKENLMVVVGEYTDQQGQQKKEHKQIGEIITMQGNDGPYQFFKIWGPHGVTEGKVWEPLDNAQQQAPQNQNRGQAPHGQQYQNNGQRYQDPSVPF